MRIRWWTALVSAAAGIGWWAPAVAAAQNGCSALGGVVESDVCRIHVSQPVYIMNMSFPLGYPDEQAVIDYLAENRAGFINVAQISDSRDLPYEMDTTFQTFTSGPDEQGTSSVVFTMFQDVGGVQPITWYKSFTYDVSRRRPITTDTLFAPDSAPLETIFPIVQQELDRHAKVTSVISPQDGMDLSTYQNFAITDDSVIFFFGQGDLLPAHAGTRSVEISRSALPPLQI